MPAKIASGGNHSVLPAATSPKNRANGSFCDTPTVSRRSPIGNRSRNQIPSARRAARANFVCDGYSASACAANPGDSGKTRQGSPAFLITRTVRVKSAFPFDSKSSVHEIGAEAVIATSTLSLF